MSTNRFIELNWFWRSSFKLFLLLLEKAKLLDNILLTLEDNNSQIDIDVGDNVKIVLPVVANTGYSWELDGDMPEEIDLLFNNYKLSNKNQLGERTFEFIAINTGVVTLKFKYRKKQKEEDFIERRFQTKFIIE
jgi:predicted secreted protein